MKSYISAAIVVLALNCTAATIEGRVVGVAMVTPSHCLTTATSSTKFDSPASTRRRKASRSGKARRRH